jgi:NAD+ kinase
MLPNCIGLIANHGKTGADEIVREIAAACAQRSLSLRLDEHTAALIGVESAGAPEDLARDCDLIVVLGGDGTILQVVHQLGDVFPPILGINLGTLGFLTCVSAADWREAIEAIASGAFCLSLRSLLDVEVLREGASRFRELALNDAVISRGEPSRLIKLNVSVDDETLSEYNADGLIVSTPTGSTAYSLSAGGPVLTPDSGVFVVTPICPHVLTMRSVMVSDQSCVEIAPSREQPEIFLSLDGRPSIPIHAEDRIRITRASRCLPLAMLPGMSFFEVLRQKLKWSGTAV